MKIVGIDPLEVERALVAGELEYPDCVGRLGPWGWARWRILRSCEVELRHRARRSRCTVCAVTHVLIGSDSLLRRRDGVEVIGAALTAKAQGSGHRRVALLVGVPVSTVRGWLRRFACQAEMVRVRYQNRSMGQGVPHRIGRHTHPMAKPEPMAVPAATGIDYLALLADRHTAEPNQLAPHIDYTTLIESTDPAQCPGQLHIPTTETLTTTESGHR